MGESPNAGIMCRFQNDVIEDAELLDGAGVKYLSAHFEQRINDHINHATTSTGFLACIMIDQEVWEQIAQLPAAYPLNRTRDKWHRCVKVITRWHPEPAEVHEATDNEDDLY